MLFAAFSLNGTWNMAYQESVWTSSSLPTPEWTTVPDAVPGYWEDMTEAFARTPFFRDLRINPEYGIQQYPMTGFAPDMALPNVQGNFFYQRSFTYREVAGRVAVIHFAGVQNAASVWLNGSYRGRHEGYSTPFEMPIPDGLLMDGENVLTLSVSNHRLKGYADEPVSGLTSRAANECTGGITGEVELRIFHSALRDLDLRISEDCSCVNVTLEGEAEFHCQWKVFDGTTVLKSGSALNDFTFDTDGLQRWSPEAPKLYTLEVSVTDTDAVLERRFGVRRLTVDGTHFRLNGTPYFLRGICEHCYFPETIHPAHDLSYYRHIVRTIKQLGFNFIRFHTYIPEEEYMQAADELGVLVHVESPNNTAFAEWEQIVRFCRRHTSVVIYCCGNELLIDDPFIAHLHQCADVVHESTDALFSPMSALRGLEYHWVEPEQESQTKEVPFKHHPRRFAEVGSFSDMYSSYSLGQVSYFSTDGSSATLDEWNCVYNKPRSTHEICIDGTYTDLSLKDRYKGTRVGKTEMFSSIVHHLEEKGVLKKAPLYFKNSSEWQRRVRKNCFEVTRGSEHIAGYDFLGPIDTHWHTFGYDVGMMNEFYELKPGETLRNVRMYNSPTVLLHDLGTDLNFTAGDVLACKIKVSHYGAADLTDAELNIRLTKGDRCIARERVRKFSVPNGHVSELYSFSTALPLVKKPEAMKLSVTLESGDVFAENEWELYLFPEIKADTQTNDLLIANEMDTEALVQALRDGRDVLLLGDKPFVSLPTSFRLTLAGRTSGNQATVIADHPALAELPHDGFCGWQFRHLLEGGSGVCFETDDVPFDPIIEVVSPHKYVIRRAALFEFRVLAGRLLVCSFRFAEGDPAAKWLKNQLICYTSGDAFEPAHTITESKLRSLINGTVAAASGNTNLAFNPNDKTARRKNKN